MRTARDLAVSLALVGALTAMLGWYVYSYLGQRGLVDAPSDREYAELLGRSPEYFHGPSEGRFLSGVFQKKIDEAAADRLPLRRVVSTYRRLAQAANACFVGVLPWSWAPVVPMGGDVLALRNDRRLVRIPSVNSPRNGALLAKRAAYYRELAMEIAPCRVFVVAVPQAGNCLAASRQYWNARSSILSGLQTCRDFRAVLDPRVGYAWIGEGISPEAALGLYYRTDHHLSMRGAHSAYRQVVGLLGGARFAIGVPHEPRRWFTLPGVRFLGSHARLAGGFDRFSDPLEDADFALPVESVRVLGKGGVRNARTSYLAGSHQTGRFTNHYGEYFGDDRGLVEYTCRAQHQRNLLVISDSYDNSIEALLASHYRNTFFADPRRYLREFGEGFDVADLVAEKGIHDVLFFGGQEWVLGLQDMKEE